MKDVSDVIKNAIKHDEWQVREIKRLERELKDFDPEKTPSVLRHYIIWQAAILLIALLTGIISHPEGITVCILGAVCFSVLSYLYGRGQYQKKKREQEKLVGLMSRYNRYNGS